MRKTILALATAAAMALPVTAANADHWRTHHHNHGHWAPLAGAAVGTAVGIGLYDGWFGTTAAGTALGATTAGAITGGFIAGVGTAAVIHAVATPCTGFHALFGGSGCRNGQYVGYR
ncbi:MAG: hypothetical protein KF794_00410 [Xanthobacteraceae bacterium]|nr:hypothetical protein [Xanthobacteraceae bacterium]QYK45219.1 MAG: hypothetical protein KF794_00410 [Xanthobacteraceae bacterium]HMN52183.1 hypothetical protein [Xanthobacteraceae bacterium]